MTEPSGLLQDHVSTLPFETIVQIGRHIPLMERHKLALCCRRMAQIFQSSGLLTCNPLEDGDELEELYDRDYEDCIGFWHHPAQSPGAQGSNGWNFAAMIDLSRLKWPLELCPDVGALRSLDQFAVQMGITLNRGLAKALLAHFIVLASISWRRSMLHRPVVASEELLAGNEWFAKMLNFIRTSSFVRPSGDRYLNGKRIMCEFPIDAFPLNKGLYITYAKRLSRSLLL